MQGKIKGMMSDEKACARCFLSGTVQGVGMRAYVRMIARKLFLSGYVRNLLDGRVEVVAEGNREKIEKFLQTIQEGSYAGYVSGMEIAWEEASDRFTRFEITI